MRNRVLILMVFFVPLLMSACTGGPKSEATHYSERMPDQIGAFRLNDKRVELSPEAVSNIGHVTLNYELKSSGNIYVVFNTYGSESAADVAYDGRLRDLKLMGAVFSTDNVPRYKAMSRAQVTDMAGGQLAIFKGSTIIIEVQYIKADPDSTIADEDWAAALTAVRDVAESLR